MSIKLLNKQHLEFLSLTGGSTCSSESTRVKMPHCWKSHATARIYGCKSLADLAQTTIMAKCYWHIDLKKSINQLVLQLLVCSAIIRRGEHVITYLMVWARREKIWFCSMRIANAQISLP